MRIDPVVARLLEELSVLQEELATDQITQGKNELNEKHRDDRKVEILCRRAFKGMRQGKVPLQLFLVVTED